MDFERAADEQRVEVNWRLPNDSVERLRRDARYPGVLGVTTEPAPRRFGTAAVGGEQPREHQGEPEGQTGHNSERNS